MRKVVLLLLMLASYVSHRAQAPLGINYQAAARDNSGNILANTAVSFRLALRQGSAGGTVTYQETHDVTTNALGLASMVIGSGTVNAGSFSATDWSIGPYFLQVEMAVPPASFQLMGTSQLVSAPYALYAAHSADRARAGKGITISNDSIHSSWSYIGNDIVNNNSGNVGIGTSPVNQKLEVNGGVSIGNTSNGTPGSLRYTGSDFEGATGTGWASFTKTSVNYYERACSNSFSSTLRSTMVLSTDSLVVPETGNYLILCTGKGANGNGYDMSTGVFDYEGHVGIVNTTVSPNYVGGSFGLFYSEYTFSNSQGNYKQYVSQAFTVSALSHLTYGDVLKVGGIVFSTGTAPTTNWSINPQKIQLIKLN